MLKLIGKAVSCIADSLSKVNRTIHGSADAAAKTTKHIKAASSC